MKQEPFFDPDFLYKLERLALVARRATVGQLQGERRSPKRGQSVEFADFRPYVPGDDFRRIDWNAYARLERFFIKLFVEEQDLTVHFILDASKSMDWGQPNKLWYAAQAAGALGYVAMANLDRVTMTAFGSGSNGKGNGLQFFPPHRGKRQAMALFSYLQQIKVDEDNGASPGQGPAKRLTAYAANATHPGPLLLISDLMGDGWLPGLSALAAHKFEVTVLHVLSPDEVDPPLNGDLKLLDVETEADVEITADYDFLERYRQTLQAWQDEIRRYCSARGIVYVPLETTLPVEELLFAWLRRQGVLK